MKTKRRINYNRLLKTIKSLVQTYQELIGIIEFHNAPKQQEKVEYPGNTAHLRREMDKIVKCRLGPEKLKCAKALLKQVTGYENGNKKLLKREMDKILSDPKRQRNIRAVDKLFKSYGF